MKFAEYMASRGWKKVESPTFYAAEPPLYRVINLADPQEYKAHGAIYTRNGKTAAVFLDEYHGYHEYVFGDGAEEFIADSKEYK